VPRCVAGDRRAAEASPSHASPGGAGVSHGVQMIGTESPRSRPLAAGTVLAFLLVVAGTTWWHLSHWAFVDFVNVLYCPMRSFLEGKNPYDASTYLKLVETRLVYSPLVLLLHLPLGFLSLETAQAVHYAVNVALTPVLSVLALRLAAVHVTTARTFAHAALVLLSLPGHGNLVQGQTVTVLVIATYVSLLFARRRPWLSGLALAVTTFKPTFAVPLALLMLVRRDIVPVVVGLTLAGLASAASFFVIAERAGGLAPLISLLAENYRIFADRPDVAAFSSPYRLDAIALVGRLLGGPLGIAAEVAITLGVIGLGAFGVARLARSDSPAARRLSESLICVTVLTCTHHQRYDGLILALPLTTLAIAPWVSLGPVAAGVRWLLLGLLAVPAVNHLASFTPLHLLHITGGWWVVVTCLNGAALVTALLTYVIVAVRPPTDSTGRRARIGPGSSRVNDEHHYDPAVAVEL
jgi:hypothetical protein